MQIKVNKNYVWANVFIDQLAEHGVKYACISPGSRSTPLTYALSQNRKIKSYVIIDERTSGFFALGIAKETNSPVIVVTTSGTATAELYPAIIEAYQNRVPLIICTADRPAYLRNSGANQTINQDNLYKNHIRFYYDTGLPNLEVNRLSILKKKASIAYNISLTINRGPVHINFPFDKPLEPDVHTDYVEEKIINASLPELIQSTSKKIDDKLYKKSIKTIKTYLKKDLQGLITVGPGNFSNQFLDLLEKFSTKYSMPVFADASSGLSFKFNRVQNLIPNFDTLIRCESFKKLFAPKINFHFGRTATSSKLEEFLSDSGSKKFIINRFGDMFDDSRKSKIITVNEEQFLQDLIDSDLIYNKDYSKLIHKIEELDREVVNIKSSIILSSKKINEPAILLEILNSIPPNSNLMIGNSIPIRDLDFFSPVLKKNINVFQNRGASGIDGITSTALGISANSKYPTYLITGDLSFYYDINSLLIAKQYALPLITFLINNNGGAIFKFLPIAENKAVFKKYFFTPTNLSFKNLIEAFNIEYKELKTHQDIINHIKVSSVRKKSVVFEIKTNAELSLLVRKKYWAKVNKFVEYRLRDYET
jgi:2-succinyl-5-enolpyruvyl-6-hydroxy-3-cyclohexene-1-carboxylate synthase